MSLRDRSQDCAELEQSTDWSGGRRAVELMNWRDHRVSGPEIIFHSDRPSLSARRPPWALFQRRRRRADSLIYRYKLISKETATNRTLFHALLNQCVVGWQMCSYLLESSLICIHSLLVRPTRVESSRGRVGSGRTEASRSTSRGTSRGTRSQTE